MCPNIGGIVAKVSMHIDFCKHPQKVLTSATPLNCFLNELFVWIFAGSPEIPAHFDLQAFQVCISNVTPGTP